MNKVLVGTPTYEAHEEFLPGFLAAINKQTIPCEILFANTSSSELFSKRLAATKEKIIKVPPAANKYERVVEARRAIMKKFLAGDWTHLFFVDTDVFIESDATEKLLARKKDVVSGVYLTPQKMGGKVYVVPISFDFGPQEDLRRPMLTWEVLEPKMLSIHSVGFGLCLLSKKVIENVSVRPYNGGTLTEDIIYCRDARAAGFEIFLDTDVWGEHHFISLANPNNKLLTRAFNLAYAEKEKNKEQ